MSADKDTFLACCLRNTKEKPQIDFTKVGMELGLSTGGAANKFRTIMKQLESTNPVTKTEEKEEKKPPTKAKSKPKDNSTKPAASKRKASNLEKEEPSNISEAEGDDENPAEVKKGNSGTASEPEEPPKKKRKTAAAGPKKSEPVVKATSDAEDAASEKDEADVTVDTKEVMKPSTAKKGTATKAKKEKPATDADGDEQEPKKKEATKKPTATKGRGKAAKAKKEVEIGDGDQANAKDGEELMASDVKKDVKPAKKPVAKGRGKGTKARKDADTDNEEVLEPALTVSDAKVKKEPAKKPATNTGRGKATNNKTKVKEETNLDADTEGSSSSSEAEMTKVNIDTKAKDSQSRDPSTASRTSAVPRAASRAPSVDPRQAIDLTQPAARSTKSGKSGNVDVGSDIEEVDEEETTVVEANGGDMGVADGDGYQDGDGDEDGNEEAEAPQPTRVFFDPFNSSATGHQRAENRLSGSTSWRDSRTHKLANQFKDQSGGGGQQHLPDLVGAGSEHFGKDGRKENGDWEAGAPGLREEGWQDIRSILGNTRKRRSDDAEDGMSTKKMKVAAESVLSLEESQDAKPLATIESLSTSGIDTEAKMPEGKDAAQIFRGLTMYLNGSTMPLVSDHKLKQLWVQHGGNASIALGRRTVTHVILGERGIGGGLAATKIQKENTTVRGKGIKYVGAQWVLDSIEKGKRQPECRYAAIDVKNKLGGSRQASVPTLLEKRVRLHIVPSSKLDTDACTMG